MKVVIGLWVAVWFLLILGRLPERKPYHTASAVGAQEQITDTSAISDYRGTLIGEFCFYYPTPFPLSHQCQPRPLSDSAILCQPYFDLAIPEDIKNSVLWMFCDSIKYMVWADVDSDSITKLHTDIVYFTYYGAMTYWEYRTNECPDYKQGDLFHCSVNHPHRWEYGLTDWHTPFAVLWQRKVMWSRE